MRKQDSNKLFIPTEIKRNITIQLRIEDYQNIKGVELGFGDRDNPEQITTWYKCVKIGSCYTCPEPLELNLLKKTGDQDAYWLSDWGAYPINIKFESDGKLVHVYGIELNFIIFKEAYLAIYENKIDTLQILVCKKETKDSTILRLNERISLVWKGPLHKVPDECLLFKGLKGRPRQARFLSSESEYVDALTLELFDPLTSNTTLVYFLTFDDYQPIMIPYCGSTEICGMQLAEINDAAIVYVAGYAFDYISPIDDKRYSILRPTSIWKDELPDPVEQASRYIINKVGEEYYNTYFTQVRVEKNPFSPEDWTTRVDFRYNITLGNYSRTRGVNVYFNEEDFIINTVGVPLKDNLMPFYVTREEAKEIAIREGSPCRILELETEIYYWKKLINGTRIDKYVWIVSIYLTPREAKTGSILEAVIDVHSGEVYEIVRIGWEMIP